MKGKGIKHFLKNSLIVQTIIFRGGIDALLLYIFKTPTQILIIVDLIISLGVALLYFDERIEKLEKKFENINKKFNKKGVSQLVAIILLILVMLLILAILSPTPSQYQNILYLNIT